MNALLYKSGLFFTAGVLALGMFSCNQHRDDEDTRQPYVIPDSLMRTLKIDTVKTSNITSALKFSGVVDFNTDKVENIYPLVSGNLQDVTVMPGDYVHAGQTLGVVRSAEIANYTSSLESARAQVQITKKQLQQQQDLAKSGLASQVDVVSAQSNYEQAIAAYTAAQRVMSMNGNSTSGQYLLKSPIDGFVVAKNANSGTNIRSDNSSPLFVISDLKNVWVEANVYEENIGKVHEGDTAEVTTISYPGKVFTGKVNRLMNILDPTTKVMKMRVILSNPGYLLKPQMFATVSLNDKENKKAISISSTDLIFDHSQYYVLILQDKKNVQIRPVNVISINGKTAYLSSGVAAGERLIGSDALLIYGSLNS